MRGLCRTGSSTDPCIDRLLRLAPGLTGCGGSCAGLGSFVHFCAGLSGAGLHISVRTKPISVLFAFSSKNDEANLPVEERQAALRIVGCVATPNWVNLSC